MFVLGIDPGLTRCGYGVVEGHLEGPEGLRPVTAGVLVTPPSDPVEVRLGSMCQELDDLLSEFDPDHVVVEKIFFQRNARTAISVAQASGLAIGLAVRRGIPVRQFTSQEVKLTVTGYGAAAKSQVQSMVGAHLGLAAVPEPADAADALALAITFLMTARRELRVVGSA